MDVGEEELRRVLATHPGALVAAVRDDGLFVAMPASVPIGDHPVATGRSALDLVHLADRSNVITAWRRAGVDGVGRTVARIAGTEGDRGLLHLLDARAAYGVFLAVLVPLGRGDGNLGSAPAFVPAPPRVVRSRKDSAAILLEVDADVTAVLGWAPAALVGRRSVDLIHPDDRDAAIDAWMEVLGKPGATNRVRVRHLHQDGRWVWLEIANRNLLDTPGAGYVECEMLDISQEMEAQEALRASEQLLRRLAGALPVGVFHLDRDRRLLYANDQLHQILGSAPGTPSGDLITGVVEVEAFEASVSAVLVSTDVDVQLHVDPLDGGPRRRCTLSLRALVNPDGEVTGAVGCLTDVTDAARMQAELERRATTDFLTGCVNRATAMAALEAALASPAGGTAVAFVDLDGFKAINDHHGHAVGDDLLTAVAARLRTGLRGGDVVGRLGGDEFLVICRQVDDDGQALALAERIAAVVCAGFVLDGVAVRASASVGVARAVQGEGAEAVIARADAAMYDSKRLGGRVAVLAGPPAMAGATA